jgi:HlyD family secretion protein
MKRISILIGGIFLASGVAAIFVKESSKNPHAAPPVSAGGPQVIAAAGRVEPVSEEVTIASQLPGRLASVPVEEGDRIRRGQVLATLVNDDYAARVQYARAQLQMKQAGLSRLLNGARDQERREVAAAVAEARAVMENAHAEMERRRVLHQSGDLSRAEFERAEREFRVAQARVDAAIERSSFVSADAREDERRRAEAEVASAAAQVREAEALLEKTHIRSPLTGVVLRKHRRAGESVSDSFDTPVVTIADSSRLRVRMDVDETDVARIREGQRVYVTADAYGDRKFWGAVVRIGRVLGRKNVRTDEPAERVDTKILETLVDLEETNLPAGLRVNAYVVVN